MSEPFHVRSLAATYGDGHVLQAHTHPWAQLVYARSGVMHVMADGQLWLVPRTRAIWIPSEALHEITMKGKVAMRTLYVDDTRAGAARRGVSALEVSPLLSELIVHIVTVGMLDSREPPHDRLAGVLMDLVATAPDVDLMLPLPRDERALRLVEHFRAAPGDCRDLQDLASNCGASLRTLQRCFFEEIGMTIEAWRTKVRLVHAAAELAQGASVTSTALGCGYASASAFTAVFRKQFGVTPSSMRSS